MEAAYAIANDSVPTWVRAAIPCPHAVDEPNRAIDLAERPQCDRQIDHCGGAGVLPKAKGQIVIAAGLEQGERTFQFMHGVDKFAGEIVGHALDPMRDAGLGRIGSPPDAGEECRRMRSH
jgi:hypothetical protein